MVLLFYYNMYPKNLKIYPLILTLGIFLFACDTQNHKQSKTLNILNFGALGDGKKLCTNAIQKAIDQAHKNGGGKVIIPSGTFLSGTIFLKSNINLQLEKGAILLGSPNIEDYTEMTWGHNKDRQPWHLIFADNVENVSITGEGLIDGNAEYFWEPYEKDQNGEMLVPRWIKAKEKKISPLIDINNSRNIQIKDISVKTGGGWCIHLFNTSVARIRGLIIDNNIYSPNSDGIDLTGCSDVTISDCYIKTCDDAIVLKTVENSRETERITITNCIIETLCVGVKLGAGESYKNMRDVTISNCSFNGTSRLFGLYSKNGAILENIVVNNLTGNTNAKLVYNRPIQLMVEKNNGRVGGIRNVYISNLAVHTDGRIMLSADNEGFIENVNLSDITLNYPRIEDPEPMIDGARSNQFPRVSEFRALGAAQAAIVAENIKDLNIRNLKINWPGPQVPKAWQHPERIENGTTRIHTPDYSNPRETEFAVLWGKNLNGGQISLEHTQSSSKDKPKYTLENSNIKVIETP